MYFKFIWVVFIIHTAEGLILPAHYKRCRVSPLTDNLPNHCLEDAVEKAVRFLSVKGDPYFGAPKLDPLVVGAISIGKETPPHILDSNIAYTKLHLYGLSNYKINHFYGSLSSPKGFVAHMGGEVPQMFFTGVYKVHGTILRSPVFGDGLCNTTVEGVRANVSIYGEPQWKFGKEYLKINKLTLKIDMDKIKESADNLFNGNKKLGENILGLFNKNWSLVYKQINHIFENSIAPVLQNYAKLILESVPFEDIFIVDKKIQRKPQTPDVEKIKK